MQPMSETRDNIVPPTPKAVSTRKALTAQVGVASFRVVTNRFAELEGLVST